MPTLSLTKFIEDIIHVKRSGLFGLGQLFAESFSLFAIIALVFGIASYLAGSLNFAIIISRIKYRDDIRNYGSKNAGFTNMKRVFGTKAAIATIVGDMLKGVVCTGLALLLFGEVIAYVAGLGAILGHCYPIYYGFKGGKGVATLASVVLVLEPIVFLILFVLFAIITLTSKYLSLASIMVALLYPLLLDRFYAIVYESVPIFIGSDGEKYGTYLSPVVSLITIFISLFVIFKHRSNIKRIWSGTENKFYLKNKPLKEAAASVETPKSLHTIDKDDPEDQK